MGSKHMVSTEAVSTACRGCGTPTFVAYDEGYKVAVDQEVIGRVEGNLAGELAALLDNKLTFTMTVSRELVERTTERVLGKRPGGTIHAEHRCPR